jgi:hypothetical protein
MGFDAFFTALSILLFGLVVCIVDLIYMDVPNFHLNTLGRKSS